MPVISRDRLTRTMQGDPFGSVSARSRFVVGDPGLFSFLGRALKGGAGFLKGAVKAQLGVPASGVPSTTSMVKSVAVMPPFGITKRKRGIPQIEIPSFPFGARGQRGIGLTAPTRRRRMHVTNVHALRRAMRRVQGFATLAHKTISFTKRIRMKRRRRTRAA